MRYFYKITLTILLFVVLMVFSSCSKQDYYVFNAVKSAPKIEKEQRALTVGDVQKPIVIESSLAVEKIHGLVTLNKKTIIEVPDTLSYVVEDSLVLEKSLPYSPFQLRKDFSEGEDKDAYKVSVASLVFGILSYVPFITLFLTIPLAIILGIIGKRRGVSGEKMAKAGLILGVVALSLLILVAGFMYMVLSGTLY